MMLCGVYDEINKVHVPVIKELAGAEDVREGQGLHNAYVRNTQFWRQVGVSCCGNFVRVWKCLIGGL